METLKRIVRNSAAVMGGLAANSITAFIASLLLARHWGGREFGSYSLVLSILYFYLMIEEIWLKPVIVREIANSPSAAHGRLFGNMIMLKGSCALIAVALIALAGYLLPVASQVKTGLAYLTVLLPLTVLISSYEVIFRCRLRMGPYASSVALGNLLYIACIVALMRLHAPLEYFFAALAFCNGVAALLVIVRARHLAKLDFTLELPAWKRVLTHSLPLALTALFIAVYQRLDQALVYGLSGAEATGLYAASGKLTDALTIIPMALATSVLPVLSRQFISSRSAFASSYRLCFRFLAAVIFPIAVFATLFSERIIGLVYGAAFAPGAASLAILVWSEIFIFFGIMNKQVLIASHQQKLDPLFTGVSAAVNVGLNVVLIPRFGFLGAAAANLAASATGPLIGYFLRATHDYSFAMFRSSLKPLFCALAAAVVIVVFGVPFVPALALYAVVYLVVLWTVRGMGSDEVRLVRSLFKRLPSG